MKTTKLIFLLLSTFILLIFTESCKKEEITDPCESITCQNDGLCIDGTCDCPFGFIGTNCESVDHAGIQEALDAGQSPKSLFDSGLSLDVLYGKNYACGLIYFLNTMDGSGKVAATIDATSTGDWLEALDYCENLTLEGKTDWVFPSETELNQMWTNLADIDNDGINTGPADPNNLGGFEAVSYWSSTEVLGPDVLSQSFSNGETMVGHKNVLRRVRASRSF